MVDHTRFTYQVFWWEADQEFVGTCLNFPGLSYLHENQAEAFKGIVDVVGDVVADMTANQEPIPHPVDMWYSRDGKTWKNDARPGQSIDDDPNPNLTGQVIVDKDGKVVARARGM